MFGMYSVPAQKLDASLFVYHQLLTSQGNVWTVCSRHSAVSQAIVKYLQFHMWFKLIFLSSFLEYKEQKQNNISKKQFWTPSIKLPSLWTFLTTVYLWTFTGKYYVCKEIVLYYYIYSSP